MARVVSQEVYDRRKARRIQRKQEAAVIDYTGFVNCGYCHLFFKPRRVKRWLGEIICPSCEDYPREILHKLIEFKVVKLKKESKLPPPRTRPHTWGWLGEFDEKRPWLIWEHCEFCQVPQCLNNNDRHKVSRHTFRGHLVCGKCLRRIKNLTKILVERKYLKIKEVKVG